MSLYGHTYDDSCLLQAESNQLTRRASEVSMDPPKVRAQFFYSSPLPIDDPLTPVPPPSGSSATGSLKVPSRPFSVCDNIALEEAWQIIQRSRLKKRTSHEHTSALAIDRGSGHDNLNKHSSVAEHMTDTIKDAETQGIPKPEFEGNPEQGDNEDDPKVSVAEAYTKPVLVNAERSNKSPRSPGDPHLTMCNDPDHTPLDDIVPIGSDEIDNDEFKSGMSRRRHRSPSHRRNKTDEPSLKRDITPPRRSPRQHGSTGNTAYGSSPSERDTTGTPFLRVSSRLRRSRSGASRRSRTNLKTSQTDGTESANEEEWTRNSWPRNRLPENAFKRSEIGDSESDHPSKSTAAHRSSSGHRESDPQIAYITVGVSRLHVVELPNLKMGPIYWDPIHDICSVARGTWFYKDTMIPVESDVANQIEEGYGYIKPWTRTYADELNSCLEIGADAELKVVYRLWPVDEPAERIRSETGKRKTSLFGKAEDQLEPDEQVQKQAIIIAANPENRAAGTLNDKDHPTKLYTKSSIIYANARDAQILRPSLLPSVTRGRRPLASIRKGRPIGIPVVRGFDHKAWEKLHPPSKKAINAMRAQESLEAFKAANSVVERPKTCFACLSDEVKPKATDLVLVIHGIGQKLSERVESFHFTHAINAFRRQVNVELETEAVKPWLRQDLGNIMVLPINWRSTLKLEDGGPEPNPNRNDESSTRNQFNLKDITAESIPAVRNLISDVMLDIPYYLSHHKDKMIAAVVKEANRIYRLWVKNNPGFKDSGRVHLIAHSLGSVMALDILSKQPTRLSKQLNLDGTKPPRDHMFEFDTTNLFFCGSPAGFFLLLNRAPLLPRKDRNKPGADCEDNSPNVVGEAGTYGCLAVDNLYNVMHYNDPIAYRLNACVDVDYAASLQPASVPSTANSWMQSIGSIFRSRPIPPNGSALDDFPSRPTAMKMPSTLEMETHDFTREEIAERRMYLLNDNGQIDYTLRSGGGPLEIQYLNMLSAHSSYWILQDFVRFLVVEIGRKSGKNEAMTAMKATKKVRVKG